MIYTYDGLVTEIKNRLSLLSDWNTILYYGVYQRIVDMLAYTGEKLVYLAEFLYREAKWITAEKRDSLVKLAIWLGYIPYRKTGAIGELKLSYDPTFNSMSIYTGKEVNIPRWVVFTNTDSDLITYCTESTFYYTGFIGNVVIPVKEGTPKEFLYIAQGIVNECVYVYSDSTDNTEIQVQIVDTSGNFLYEAIITTNLYLINNVVDYYCEISNSAAYDYIKICFGDGINSKKLIAGERVLVKYADTKGASGDITSSNVITVLVTTLVDEDNLPVTLYVTNDEGIVGGSEIENIESIRNNAPNLFQIGSLLSSTANWEAAINLASYVNKSIVWTIESLGLSTTVSDQNVVYFTAVSTTGENLTTIQQGDIIVTYLTPKKCLTEMVAYTALQKIYVRFDITAKIALTQTFTVLDAAIKTALNTEYDILTTTFQKNIYESNFYRIIDEIPNIIYHTTKIYYMESDINIITSNLKLKPSYTSIDTPNLDKQNYLVLDSFEIWIKRKIANAWVAPLQIAYTSGITILGMNGYTITGGFVSYSTNQVSFTIAEIVADVTHVIYGIADPGDSDPLGYKIFISYKMQDGNTPATQQNSIRLPYFYQITDIEDSFINADLSYIS